MVNPESLPDPEHLEAFIYRCIEVFASNDPRSVPIENERAFLLLFGTCVQTVRYAEAYLTLCKRGLSLEARAIARVALEHAATAEYAYFRVDGLDRLVASAEQQTWNLRARMHRWTGIADYAPGPEPTKAPRLPNFARDNDWGLMRLLDPNSVMLEPGYSLLSQAVHVTEQTVTGFFRESADGSARILLDHRGDDDMANFTIYLVAEACMLVTYLDAHLRKDAPLLAELDFRSETLRLPMRLDQDWPHEQRARSVG